MAGMIRRRPSGSYQAIAAYRDETGKLVQLTKTCPSKTEAEDVLPDLLKAARRKSRPAQPMTLTEMLDLWWEVHSPRLAASTRRTDRYILEKWLKGKLGPMKLGKLTTFHIDRAYNEMTAEGLGPDAVKHAHNILRRALGQGVKYKWIPDNPAEGATLPRIPKRRLVVPSPEEFEKLLIEADKTEWFGVYLRLSLVMSGRRGEITALRWGDFDENKMVMVIDEALSIGDEGVVVGTTKEVHSVRELFIGQEMTRRLVDYRTKIDRFRAAAELPPLSDRDFIFSLDPYNGKPINPATASRTFKRVREAAGMPDIKLHSVRKLASSWMQKEGISLPTASYRLGHSRNSATHTTLDIYTGRVAAEDREAGAFLDRLVNGRPDLVDEVIEVV